MDYVAPEFKKDAFNCPFCNAYSQMKWVELIEYTAELLPLHVINKTPLYSALCVHCHNHSYWRSSGELTNVVGEMIYPPSSLAPMPHVDLPEDCKKDYDEARIIVGNSLRGAGALLRLVLQKLCAQLGGTGKNINDDIKKMVENGLSLRLQQAFDIVRITGNNAVHPLELNLDEKPELVTSMFKLVNMIVEEMITKPKELDNLFDHMPENAKQAIAKRDGKPSI